MFSWFKRRRITDLLNYSAREQYTSSNIREMFSDYPMSTFSNYYGYCDLFFTIRENNSIVDARSCKEEITSAVKSCIECGYFCKIGIQVSGKTAHDLRYKSMCISKELYSLEKKFNLKPHTMEVLGICETDSVYAPSTGKQEVILVFTLDKEWFNNPVSTSFVLQSLRNSARKSDSFWYPQYNLEQTNLYKLLCSNSPTNVFGKSVKLNWGLRSFRGKFNFNYGNFKFETEVKQKNKKALKERFPKNKVFKLL